MKISAKTLFLLLIYFPLVFCAGAMALEPASSPQDITPSFFENKEEKWGIGFAARMASIPFKGDDSSKNDFIPLLYFEGEYLFLDGLEGGIKLLTRDSWQLRLLARWRFFDVPDDTYDAQIDTDVLDWGLQIHYQADQTPLFFKVDLMADER